MSILIKGMDMPTSCYKCQIRQRDGMDIVCPVAHERFSVTDVNILGYRLDNCPLVPVPPHGDLIDRDSLMKGEGRYIISFGKEGIDVVEINRAPTIIPAEEGE